MYHHLQAKDRGPGMEIDGRRIRVDFSITTRAHTPTPGIYLGKPTAYVSTVEIVNKITDKAAKYCKRFGYAFVLETQILLIPELSSFISLDALFCSFSFLF